MNKQTLILYQGAAKEQYESLQVSEEVHLDSNLAQEDAQELCMYSCREPRIIELKLSISAEQLHKTFKELT